MKMLNCLIIEDEPLAAEVLEEYIAEIPFLVCKGICRDAIYAMKFLQKETIDVLLIDIHLPKIKGLDFLRTLNKPPQVIITTAYREYALEGYELNVVDYLLKPISFSRFLMAVNKLRQTAGKDNTIPDTSPHLLININKKRIKVYLEDILYIESRREYITIVTKDSSFVTKLAISEAEAQMANSNLLRVHRSFIVAVDKIRAFNAAIIEIQEHKIPVGRSYRDVVRERLIHG